MTAPVPEESRTWFPLILAGGFVAFALAVAFLAYAANREGEPERASSVDGVAELAVEAVDRADRAFAGELSCAGSSAALTAFVPAESQEATKSDVVGERSGSFLLAVVGDEWRITVGRDGDRSCIESVSEVS